MSLSLFPQFWTFPMLADLTQSMAHVLLIRLYMSTLLHSWARQRTPARASRIAILHTEWRPDMAIFGIILNYFGEFLTISLFSKILAFLENFWKCSSGHSTSPQTLDTNQHASNHSGALVLAGHEPLAESIKTNSPNRVAALSVTVASVPKWNVWSN